MQWVKVNDTNEHLYKTYIEAHPEANIYHTLQWKDLIQLSYGYKPYYYLMMVDNNPVCCLNFFQKSIFGLKKSFSQIPFSHYVPFLINDNYKPSDFITAIDALIGNHKLLIKDNLDLNAESIHKISSNYISVLSLMDEQSMWEGLNKSNIQRNIKKAMRSNLTVDSSNSKKSYEEFYELQALTRKKQGSPMYPKNFFSRMYNLLAQQGMAYCYIAKDINHLPIAGLIILSYKRRAIYAYGGSRSEHMHLSKRPNHLLMWQAICDSQKRGDCLFDFGSTPKSHESLLRYKSYWNAQTSDLIYTCFNSEEASVFSREGLLVQLASKFLQGAPVRVNKTIGPLLLKFLG
jgi:lipid II:glycine glycyltransferase (peptidoglycan interpeptide bridge formation enzyme)